MAVSLSPSGLTLGSTTVADWADVGGGKVLQVKAATNGTSTTVAGQYINENSISASAGYQLLSSTLTAQSSTSRFIVFAKPIMSENDNTDAGCIATLCVNDSTLLSAVGSGWFAYTHGYNLGPQTPPNTMIAEWSGSHSAGSSYTFRVRVGNHFNGTNSIRLNNLSTFSYGFSSTSIESTMIIYEVEV